MVQPTESEPEPKEELNLEEGSAQVTLQDVYILFYLLVKQNQQQNPGTQMAFDLKVFKSLPKQIKVNFQQKDGKLLAWIPEKKKDRKKKSLLYLPKDKIITFN